VSVTGAVNLLFEAKALFRGLLRQSPAQLLNIIHIIRRVSVVGWAIQITGFMVVACSGLSGASLFRDADVAVVSVGTRGYPGRR